jgi:hypothetical protein
VIVEKVIDHTLRTPEAKKDDARKPDKTGEKSADSCSM